MAAAGLSTREYRGHIIVALLAAPRGPVRRLLALTGLIDVFSVHASVADAVRIARPVVTAG
jgi:hypothetical protein